MSEPYTDPDYPAVRLVPAWHGTQQDFLKGIFTIGYSALATTDTGYFGKGLYSAYEAEYPYRVYTKKHGENGSLILNWVAIFSPLPVINNGEFKPEKAAIPPDKPYIPERHGDMCILMGKGNYGNYDAHFVPVTPKNPLRWHNSDYFPCKTNQDPVYTEIVVFEAAACLPRYLVKLRTIPSPETRLIEKQTKERQLELIKAQQLKERELKEQWLKDQEQQLKEQQLKKQQMKEQRLIQERTEKSSLNN